jgi:hypothetical protein
MVVMARSRKRKVTLVVTVMDDPSKLLGTAEMGDMIAANLT